MPSNLSPENSVPHEKVPQQSAKKYQKALQNPKVSETGSYISNLQERRRNDG